MKAQTPIPQEKLEPVSAVGLPPTLVIIDSGVANYHILATGVHPNLEVAILQPEADGIEQISKLLAEKSVESKITAVHLISHGAPGSLYLGNSTLELNNISRYRPQLMQWGITHLYLYGCQVAAGDAGAEFLQQLHHISKANIAASTTVTGNQDLGGNWKLESSIGNIPPDNPLSPETLTTYPGRLDPVVLVQDIVPGLGSSSPSELTVFNNKLYFTASDGTHGEELWQYDGTTASLVQDLRPGVDNSSPSDLTIFNNQLYFTANDGIHGPELWEYDGTTASLVQDLRPGFNGAGPSGLTVFNNKLYFAAFEDISYARELYVLNAPTTSAETDTDTNIVEPLPRIAGVSITPANNYGIGQELEFIVTFSQAVTISSEVFLPLTLDTGSGVNATLVGTGESATTHTFRYTIAPGDEDLDGIKIGPELLTTDGATIVNSNGISAVLTLNNVGDTTTLLVDGIPPNAPQITPADITNGVIEGTAEPGSTVEVFRDGNAIGTTTADAEGNWTFTPETLLPEGEYYFTFTATATDAAGNVSVASTRVNVTVLYMSSDDPGTDDPGTEDPVTGDSGTDDLGTDDPVTDDPGTDDLGTDDSGTDDPGIDDSGTDDPVTDDSGTDDSGTDDPVTDDPVTDDPETDDSGTDDPVTDDPGTNDSGTDDPGTGGESSPLGIQIFGPGPASINQLLVNNPVSTPLVEVASILADVPDLSNFSITLPTLPTLEITLNNTPGNPVVIGTPEPDAINGTNEAEFIQGLGGNDQIFGLEGNDILHSNQGDDFIDAGPGDDLVHGGQGKDYIVANSGNNEIYGDVGEDTLVGGPGNDFMNGNQGNDVLFAVAGENTLHGGQGEDTLVGGTGNDVLFGDLGNDLIYAGSGNNFLYGNQGNDTLVGGDEDDVLYGGKDDDLLIGGAGNDWLFGDLGNDTLIGGAGSDRFVIRPDAGVDLIVDFTDGEDLIGLAQELTYNNLTLTQGSNGAVISVGNEVLAILNGVNIAVLDQQDFFEVV
jgi:ELWxxDGT repeat protein